MIKLVRISKRRYQRYKMEKFRYGLLDSLRGLVLVSMILFHACWDLVYIFGKDWNWYFGIGAYIWQQSICWTFILLSGFCWSMGRKPGKRGLIVFLAGAVISLVTVFLMPDERVVFGVLTLIGSCMLIMIILNKRLKNAPAGVSLVVCIFLFVLTRNVNYGYLGFEGINLIKLPEFLYKGLIMTFLGFTDPKFYSTDYFSLFPWIFLFLVGYFLYRIISVINDQKIMDKYFRQGAEPFSFLGKHSLIIYMLHQPVLYGLFVLLNNLRLL